MHLQACLFDEEAMLLAGRHCELFADIVSRVHELHRNAFRMKAGILYIALPIQGNTGRQYIFATQLPGGPREAVGIGVSAKLIRFGVVLIISGLVCYLLTLYIVKPILLLRETSLQLATGDLSARTNPQLERRNDELGDLVRDFNSMAAKIEGLISTQRQLLYDISHELRSPLARLNVALDLGRQRKGDDPAFAHMEEDLERMSEMIGRLLTIARLDSPSAPVAITDLNLTNLLSTVVHNVQFEADKKAVNVNWDPASTEYWLAGNEELLYSAIENILRNAVCYTPPKSSVLIQLSEQRNNGNAYLQLRIQDCGPGIPEPELANIFQPFYRVAHARDRQSGGTGLGLAIADRVIRLHQGSIAARNLSPHGLEIEIRLPGNRAR
jgi:two-component system sensor histidine kinase CpxA